MRHGLVRTIRAAFVSILREAGVPCTSEDHFRENDWPDVEAYFPPCPSLPLPHVITDVSVTCPTASDITGPEGLQPSRMCLRNARN